MCDIVDLKCGGCGVLIYTHIGDFSAAREHVHPFCPAPKCRQKAMDLLVRKGKKKDRGHGQFMVFSDVPAKRSDVCDKGAKGRAFLFIVDMPRGVACNG